MSGSPPLPPRRNADFDDRGPAAFGGKSQNVSSGIPTSRTEPRDIIRGARPGAYPQDPHLSASYPAYQMMGDVPMDQSHYQYQYQQQQNLPRAPQQPQGTPVSMYQMQPQASSSYSGTERGQLSESSSYTSPKAQRKTKGHVASACVPCKRAHLRCDAQRPCSRCLSNGKEDACIDVQHKKRGRPRLRDEREPRFEGLGSPFAPQPDHTTGRPISVYSSTDSSISAAEAIPRSSSYRILKSQGGPPEATGFGGHPQPASRMGPMQDLPSVYLTMDLQIIKASPNFRETTGVPSVGARRLIDIVSSSDRDKVYRLQRLLEEDRQEREPNYLPPIFGKAEEERVIHSVGMTPDDLAQFRLDRQEVFAFQGSDGQQRIFQIRFGLAKRESTYFVIFVLMTPLTPGPHPMSSSPFSRDTQYGYHAPQPAYGQAGQASPYQQYSSQYNEPRGREQTLPYGQPQPLTASSGPPSAPRSTPPSYAQSFARPEYQTQQTRPGPRNEMPGQPGLQSELQLPPIRSQPAVPPSPQQRGDDRSGRFDIGGLIDKPDPQRRQPR